MNIFCTTTSNPTWSVPTYPTNTQVQPFNPGVRDMRGNQFNDLNGQPVRPGLRMPDDNAPGRLPPGRFPGDNLPRNRGGLDVGGPVNPRGLDDGRFPNPPGLVPDKPKAEDKAFEPIR